MAPPPQMYGQQPPMGYPVAGAPMGYQSGAAVGSTIIVMNQQPNYVGFGRSPTQCTCPNCRANVMTNVMISPGPTAWCACILLAFLFWPCACLPCELICCASRRRVSFSLLLPHLTPLPSLFPFHTVCIDDCQDVTHSCPSCGLVIHRRAAMSN